jgi:enoyl-CoA hydratase/carnithine racemase
MSHEFVIYEKRDRIAYVTLNRPEVMNAINLQMHHELFEVFEDFKNDDDVWVAIVTGAGDRAFCAGNDLKESARRDGARGERPPFAAITSRYECWKPINAAVRGYVVAGGLELALACDLIVSADDAKFALPEVRRGMAAGAGGVHRLARQIPLKHAMGLMLTGRRIGADEAYRLGFVNEVVPAGELMAAAERWAAEILECAPLAVRLTKEAAMTGLHLPVEEAMAADRRDRRPRMLASEDFKEGPRAFAEKRKPRWVGR